MERGSSRHIARVDEQMKQEVLGTVQGIAGALAEEWKMAEPAALGRGPGRAPPTGAPDSRRVGPPCSSRWPDASGRQGLRTTFSQLSCLFLKISKPRSASSSG